MAATTLEESQPLSELSNNNNTPATTTFCSAEDQSGNDSTKQFETPRAASASSQGENGFFSASPDDVKVDMEESHRSNRSHSCYVEGVTERKPLRQRRAFSTAAPQVMTTHTALVVELKEVLKRKSKYVEVVPDRLSPDDDICEDEASEEEFSGDDDELARVTTSVSSPETGRNNHLPSPFSSSSAGDGVRSPQMQMVRVVRCAILGDDVDQFFSDCQAAANHTSKRTFEVQHGGAMVNVQIVAVIGVDNEEELPRFRRGNQNCDVFLTVFKEAESLSGFWMPRIQKINNELPVVTAGGLSEEMGRSLANQVGAKEYIDLASTGDVKPVLEAVVAAVLGPAPHEDRPMSCTSDQGLLEEPELEPKTASPTAELPPTSEAKPAEPDKKDKKAKKAAKCCCTIS